MIFANDYLVEDLLKRKVFLIKKKIEYYQNRSSMLRTNIFNLLNLLQISDSNFPTGSFSHSFGLETFIQEGQVTNKDGFSNGLIDM